MYDSRIYNYLCNQCLSPLTLWLRNLLRWGVLNAKLCDKVCQWLATGWWFSPGTPVSSTNKTDCHDITEILLKVPFNNTTLTLYFVVGLALTVFITEMNYIFLLFLIWVGNSIIFLKVKCEEMNRVYTVKKSLKWTFTYMWKKIYDF